MPPQIGSTVYILGAGASAHTGAPLLNDFLPQARGVLETRPDIRDRGAFDRTFEWVEKLRSAASVMTVGLDNLEDVFSAVELAREAGLPGAPEVYQDLKTVIVETLDRCILRIDGDRFEPDAVYERFFTTGIEISDQRVKQLHTSRYARPDAIITLNYDIILDYIIGRQGYSIDYAFTTTEGRSTVPLLKLHGSVGWAICGECEDNIRLVRPKAPDVFMPLVRDTGQKRLTIRMLPDLYPRDRCPKCRQEGTWEPLVIPPTWAKGSAPSQVGLVWQRAIQEIAGAAKLVFIGYSLPESDAFIKYLFMLGLANNKLLREIIVVNPDSGDDIKARYVRVFGMTHGTGSRLRFISKRFDQFVDGGLATSGGQR